MTNGDSRCHTRLPRQDTLSAAADHHGRYNSHGTKTMPPDAAKFNRGAQLIEQIRHATGQRRAHSEALSDPGRKGWQKQSPLS
jgi:hypothetical protein